MESPTGSDAIVDSGHCRQQTLGHNETSHESIYKRDLTNEVMRSFIRHCMRRRNLLRASQLSLIVGSILGAINHYDMFLSGEFVRRRLLQFAVTYLIPFCVSLYSSAMTGRHHEASTKEKGSLVRAAIHKEQPAPPRRSWMRGVKNGLLRWCTAPCPFPISRPTT